MDETAIPVDPFFVVDDKPGKTEVSEEGSGSLQVKLSSIRVHFSENPGLQEFIKLIKTLTGDNQNAGVITITIIEESSEEDGKPQEVAHPLEQVDEVPDQATNVMTRDDDDDNDDSPHLVTKFTSSRPADEVVKMLTAIISQIGAGEGPQAPSVTQYDDTPIFTVLTPSDNSPKDDPTESVIKVVPEDTVEAEQLPLQFKPYLEKEGSADEKKNGGRVNFLSRDSPKNFLKAFKRNLRGGDDSEPLIM